MAKNYTFAEAVKIINAGTDMESITDIGRRYPTLLHKVTKVAAKAGEDFVDLMSYMPDYLTANKVNTALKSAVGGNTDAEDTDTDTEADAEETAEAEATTEATEAAAWNESMSAKQLWDILGKAGKRKLAKSTKKADLIEACKQAFGATAEVEDEADEAEATTEETTEAGPYDGKSAMELFKECKKRGIKAAPKKPAKYYADLLVKADAEAAEATEAESDDWDEEETAEEPKETKKPEKKAGSKKAAKKEEAADDDDDWDI